MVDIDNTEQKPPSKQGKRRRRNKVNIQVESEQKANRVGDSCDLDDYAPLVSRKWWDLLSVSEKYEEEDTKSSE